MNSSAKLVLVSAGYPLAGSRDNNGIHAKPDLRVFFEMENRFRLGDPGRYPPHEYFMSNPEDGMSFMQGLNLLIFLVELGLKQGY